MTTTLQADPRQRAEQAVARLEHIGSVVGGAPISAAETTFDVVDPTTETLLVTVPESSADVVDQAVLAAREAFDSGPWPRWSPEQRGAAIHRLADLIEENAEELTALSTAEAGTPTTWAQYLHAAGPAQFFRWWGDMAIRGPRGGYREPLGIQTEPMPSDSILLKEPIGVVAGILAYNAPMLINSFKLGGALAAGCTAVLLPSPRAPLSIVAFMRLVREAGIPDGVVNLVLGGADVGAALSGHPKVDMVSFTGSVKVGRQVMLQAAQNINKVVLELGGKSPSLILPGANLELAVQGTLTVLTTNTGQQCGAPSRIFVHEDQYDEFLTLAREALTNLRVGNPWDEATQVGPAVARDHVEGVLAYMERAKADGAEIIAQAPIPEGPGAYIAPALVGGLTNDDELCREELFAPIGVVLTYRDVEQAIEVAHDTEYGLHALVWGPAADAMAIAERLRAGTVTVNGGGWDRPDAPWGGYGHSGLGAERGEVGFAEYFVTKHVHWPVVAP